MLLASQGIVGSKSPCRVLHRQIAFDVDICHGVSDQLASVSQNAVDHWKVISRANFKKREFISELIGTSRTVNFVAGQDPGQGAEKVENSGNLPNLLAYISKTHYTLLCKV